MAETRIDLGGGPPFVFSGELIAGPVSTAFDRLGTQRPRWLEVSLYARDHGGYVVLQANYSVVWHEPGGAGHVRIPVRARSAELPGNAIYCGDIPPKPGRPSCPPLGGARVLHPFSDGAQRPAPARPSQVITEAPQIKVFECPDWQSVIVQLATARHSGSGARSIALSAPMRELMALAAEVDPAFEDASVLTAGA